MRVVGAGEGAGNRGKLKINKKPKVGKGGEKKKEKPSGTILSGEIDR